MTDTARWHPGKATMLTLVLLITLTLSIQHYSDYSVGWDGPCCVLHALPLTKGLAKNSTFINSSVDPVGGASSPCSLDAHSHHHISAYCMAR